MKNLITFAEQEKFLEKLQEKINDSVINAVERPLTSNDYALLGYPSKKALQNDLRRWPIHRVNGKLYFYLSEINQFIKNHPG